MTDNHDRSGKTVWYVIRMDQPEPVEARVDSVRGRMARQAAAQVEWEKASTASSSRP